MNYKEINIGDVFSFQRVVTHDDVVRFADLSGDKNPLHIDSVYASKTLFGKNIVHGMLLASFFSTLVGMYCPGENALYLSQTIEFRSPVFFNDNITVQGQVIFKNDGLQLVTLAVSIIKENSVCVKGEAVVKVL